MSSFGDQLKPTTVIEGILRLYPLSAGILRELLQNSEDAKGTKQIFLLDNRHHGTRTLIDEALDETQGPALLAFNDACLTEEDWDAVQKVNQSSKRADTTKIGKYGLGIRSTYHITDNIQILSGSSLAVFDPHQRFSRPHTGGRRTELSAAAEHFPDQLSAFASLVSEGEQVSHFPGTIVRLPLRTEAGAASSEISPRCITPEEVRALMKSFIADEMRSALLFLSHVKTIEVREVDAAGERVLARVDVEDSPSVQVDASPGAEIVTTLCRTVTYERFDTPAGDRQTWRILRAEFNSGQAGRLFSERVGYDAQALLEREKLIPRVGIAVCTSRTEAINDGRLYTYLPLPMPTGFPVHVNALFALTPDRQNLRNIHETGLQERTSDHVVIHWNPFVFDTLLPQTWACLLRVLVDGKEVRDIYTVWPSLDVHQSQGNKTYWQMAGSKLLEVVLKSGASIWPVHGGTESRPAADLLFTTAGAQADVLSALSEVEVRVCEVPKSMYEALQLCSIDVHFLAPNSVRASLLKNVEALHGLSRAHKLVLLDYLASDGDLCNILDLPLVPSVCESWLALRNCGSEPCHTLLEAEEAVVFGHLDPSSINLGDLPQRVAQMMRAQGMRILNVGLLRLDRVLAYIRPIVSRVSSQTDGGYLTWCKHFWTWLPSCRFAEELAQSVLTFPLIETRASDVAAALSDGIFAVDSTITDALCSLLGQFGLIFLSSAFPQNAYIFLAHRGIVKNTRSIQDMMAHLRFTSTPTATDAAELRCYMSRVLDSSPALCDEDEIRMRQLPIFPLLSGHSANGSYCVTAVISKIPLDAHVYIVLTATPSVIPRLGQAVFVSHTVGEMALYRCMKATTELSDIQLLSLSIEHIIGQQPCIQVHIVNLCGARRMELPPCDYDKIGRTAFVQAEDESIRSPIDLVAPGSPISDLFLSGDSRLPARTILEQQQVVDALARHSFFRDKLSPSLISERIEWISSKGASPTTYGVAQQLLRLLDQASESQLQGVMFDSTARWLPDVTMVHLYSCLECRDSVDDMLFDQVLPVIHPKLQGSLRRLLGWDKPLTSQVLHNQLLAVIKSVMSTSEKYRRLVPTILQLARCVEPLTLDIPSTTEWIPISRRRLSNTSHAVLEFTSLETFYVVASELAHDDFVRPLLKRLGCTDRPSNSAILDDLFLLTTTRQPFSDAVARHAILLLRNLILTEHSDWQYRRIMVPSADGRFLPVSELYFNDLGSRAHLFELPEGRTLVHGDISQDLALRLGISCLHSLNLPILDQLDDEDMHEDLTTRIKNVLRQYAPEQAPNEFLANACDAGATTFSLCLDQRSYPRKSLLSPAMSELQGPALVVHNNATFKSSDFAGIRRIGLGGKEDTPNTIGRFGLGALAAYHFTDVLIVLSGKDILFLDPCRSHIDHATSRSALKLSISRVRQLYTDHLAPFDGLFGFSITDDYYNGSLFRLALRPISSSPLSPLPVSTRDVLDMLEGYKVMAQKSFYFTRLETVEASVVLSRRGVKDPLWAFKASRSSPTTDRHCRVQRLTLDSSGASDTPEDWLVATSLAIRSSIPQQFDSLIQKHRLPEQLVFGLAANVKSLPRQKQGHSAFSTLPLPIPVDLPVHINASFILADDRRSIRFDNGGQKNPESEYNRWMLSEKLPDLYFFFLQNVGPQNRAWWPKDSSGSEATISTVVTDAMYTQTHVSSTVWKPCYDNARRGTSMSDVILQGSVPRAITKVLQMLKPEGLVELSSSVDHRLFKAGLRRMDPSILRTVIAKQESAFRAAYANGSLTMECIQASIVYLLSSGPQTLLGLPLLPGKSRQLFAVSEYSTGDTFVAMNGVPAEVISALPTVTRVLALNFDAGPLLKYKELNVRTFQDELPALIKEAFGEGDSCSISADKVSRLDALWNSVADFDINKDLISNVPIVPTTSSRLLSLQKCQSADVLRVSSTAADAFFMQVLGDDLGATFVDTAHCHAYIRPWLAFIVFKTEAILKFLATFPVTSIGTRIADLTPLRHHEFATKMRVRLLNYGAPTGQLMLVARMLPVWPTKASNRIADLKSAQEMIMLPKRFLFSVAGPFLADVSPFVDYSDALCRLNVTPLTIPRFRDCLQLSSLRFLRESDLDAYRTLLLLLVQHRSQDSRDVLVPDSNRRLVSARDLYARSQPLFVAALEDHPHCLIHETFMTLEVYLEPFGLHRKVDFEAFQACAQAIHDATDGEGRHRRAAIVYRWYKDNLPLEIRSEAVYWTQLDGLRFIPRETVRSTTHTFNTDGYVRALPSIVSPREVLIDGNEAVLWTQRARAQTGTSDSLRIAHTTFGTPTTSEVVQHLRVLALQVARDHPRDSRLLGDLNAVYRWLDGHRVEAGSALLPWYREALFLNVDDPERNSWTWDAAENLIFNAPDEDGRRAVRQFMQQFKALVLLAGGTEIKAPARPVLELSPAEKVLSDWKATFADFRNRQKLVDVRIVTDDEDVYVAHRIVLAGASEYFKDMFGGGFEEATNAMAEITAPGFDSASVARALDYIYTSAPPELEDFDSLRDILLLSRDWGLQDLNMQVQGQLVDHITPRTYRDLLDIAASCEHTGSGQVLKAPLKEACNDFVRKNTMELRRLGV